MACSTDAMALSWAQERHRNPPKTLQNPFLSIPSITCAFMWKTGPNGMHLTGAYVLFPDNGRFAQQYRVCLQMRNEQSEFISIPTSSRGSSRSVSS
ncbi:hypothetical protein BaRGS_00029429 [Batillaria attramentaria]|uniref:Uncharacterized protein n=1 Tax=Batillaria attramentaria TaxID=370345 RepID=A0ABD0JXA2_9CAEN